MVDYNEQVNVISETLSVEEKKLIKMFRPSPLMNNLLYNLRYLLPEDRNLPIELCQKINNYVVYTGLDTSNFAKLYVNCRNGE